MYQFKMQKRVALCASIAAFVLTLFVGAQFETASAVTPAETNEGTGSITGIVEGPNGEIPTGAIAVLYKHEYENFYTDVKPAPIAETDVNPQTGEFEFADLEEGEYLIDIFPDQNSGYTPAYGYYAFLLIGEMYDMGTIILDEAKLVGQFLGEDQQTSVDGWIDLYNNEEGLWYGAEAVDGKFAFGSWIEPGLYKIQGHPHPSEPFGASELMEIEVPEQGFSEMLVIASTPNVWGVVLNPENEPMEHVDLFLTGFGPEGYWASDFTGDDGGWAFTGVPTGTYMLEAFAWSAGDLIPPDPIEITIPAEDGTFPLTMTFESFANENKTLTGTVLDDSGEPIDDALVSAHNFESGLYTDTQTDASGQYTLILSSGEWSIFIDQIRVFDEFGCDPLIDPMCGDFGPECDPMLEPDCEENPFCDPMMEPDCEEDPFCDPMMEPDCEENPFCDPMMEPDCEENPFCDPMMEPDCQEMPAGIEAVLNQASNSWNYAGGPKFVYFDEDDSVEDKVADFEVERADSAITGEIEMPDGSIPQFQVGIDVFNAEGFGTYGQMNWNTGQFTIPVSSGAYEVYVHPFTDEVEGPGMMEVFVDPDSIEDLGTITLLGSTAQIKGSVTDGSSGVGQIPITAWKIDGNGFRYQETNPNGEFSLNVSPGTWHIMPSPHYDNDYVYSGFGEEVEIEDGETISDVVFSMATSNSTIEGRVVDSSGAFLGDVYGWVHIESIDENIEENEDVEEIAQTDPSCGPAGDGIECEEDPGEFNVPSVVTGAPIINGSFDVKVPAGSYRIFAFVDGDGIFANTESTLDIEDNATEEIEIVAATADATISGSVVDFRSGDIITGVQGMAFGWNPTGFADDFIEYGEGSYSMDVISGTWYIDHWLEEGNYVPLIIYDDENGNAIVVESGGSATYDLPVAVKDATVSGQVLDPDGNPLPRAAVFLHGLNELDGVWIWADTDNSGSFSIQVPYGTYVLEAAYGNLMGEDNTEWFWPEPIEITLEEGETSTGNDIQFRAATSVISGTITATGAITDGIAFVWGWSENGGFNHTEVELISDGTDASGAYSFGAIDGDWVVGAVYENGNSFWFGETEATVSGDTTIDLTLAPGGEMPEADSVVFDESEPVTLELGDGTEIFIPRGAMPVTGTITLSVEPTANMVEQDELEVVGRYGYSILARDSNNRTIEEEFDEDVTITFYYDDSNMTIEQEEALIPAYYSTTTNQWTEPTTFTVYPDLNKISMQINHFTDFAVLGTTTSEQQTSNDLYIPMLFSD
ncbi:MAG: carboxypeptidase-like regulatory domain-containing protein [Chloroflexota bacterium]